jgi:CRP-like cAMP-binding protein
VFILSRAAMENLSRTIIVWDAIINKITTRSLAQKVERISTMFPQDATERYRTFLKKFPNLANRVPLQYVASYLGITKHSLSRIRKNIR